MSQSHQSSGLALVWGFLNFAFKNKATRMMQSFTVLKFYISSTHIPANDSHDGRFQWESKKEAHLERALNQIMLIIFPDLKIPSTLHIKGRQSFPIALGVNVTCLARFFRLTSNTQRSTKNRRLSSNWKNVPRSRSSFSSCALRNGNGKYADTHPRAEDALARTAKTLR